MSSVCQRVPGFVIVNFNRSKSEPVHFLQIWIIPEKKGLRPGYEQKAFGLDEKRGKLRLIGSRDGRDGSVTIHRDVDLYASVLSSGQTVTHKLSAGRGAWLQVARGAVVFNDKPLKAGDGVAIDAPGTLRIEGHQEAEVLLFDMAI
jgi:quercetin 2,3-dioxygenase